MKGSPPPQTKNMGHRSTQMRNGSNERWALTCQDHGAKARLARLCKEETWAESNIFQEPWKVWGGPSAKKNMLSIFYGQFNSSEDKHHDHIIDIIGLLKRSISPSLMRPPSHQKHLGCSGDLEKVVTASVSTYRAACVAHTACKDQCWWTLLESASMLNLLHGTKSWLKSPTHLVDQCLG